MDCSQLKRLAFFNCPSPVGRGWEEGLALLFLTLLCTCVRAQTPQEAAQRKTLDLTFFNADNNLPVAAVEVYIVETGSIAKSNRAGKATIKVAEDLEVITLQTSAYGFGSLLETIALTGTSTSKSFSLSPLAKNLDAVTVTAQEEERAHTRLRAVEGTAIYAGKKTEVVRLDALTVNLASNQARQIYAEVSGLNIYESDDAGLQLSIGGRGLDPNRSASFNTRQNGYDISADVPATPKATTPPLPKC